jgi:hypothetical protein
VDGVDKSLAEHLIDDYTNLRTVSWAATSDVKHLENKYDLDAHEFSKASETQMSTATSRAKRSGNSTSQTTETT